MSLHDENESFSIATFYKGLLFITFLVFSARLIDLQIVRGDYFRKLSDQNRIREVSIVPDRGRILARGGETLAGNTKVAKSIVFSSSEGIVKKDDKDNGYEITDSKRIYPEALAFAHITGYLGEVDKNEVGKVESKCSNKGPLISGDLIGRGGLEEVYNCTLRGISGSELLEVDSGGKIVRNLGTKEAISGEDIKTTVDFRLQKKASEIIGDKKAAMVVTGKKGEVLSLFSGPSFDPNVFISGDNNSISKYLSDKNLPMFNRALSGRFHPGSVFKPIVAIAALEDKKINSDYRYQDTGSIKINTLYGDFSYSNWYYLQYGKTEGEIDLSKALARSTDTFFYEIGSLVGIDILHDFAAEKFGLSDKTGIDLPVEIEGIIPSSDWKEQVKGERWFLGDTYNFSIGQGDIAVTPLSINRAIAAIANRGEICRPHLVGESDCKSLKVSQNNIDQVILGMKLACSTGGTAYTFFDFVEKHSISVACKTGTAQNVGEEPHSWFTIFAPVDNPEVIATFLVENGGEGSKVAGALAREFMDYWVETRTGGQ